MNARNLPAAFWLVPTIWPLLLMAKAWDWSPPSVFSFLKRHADEEQAGEEGKSPNPASPDA